VSFQASKPASEAPNQESVNQSLVEQQQAYPSEEQKHESSKQKVMNSTLPIAPKKSLEDTHIESK
jgi:hypothetical protein